ncbi:hypothetical protein ACQJBY_070468 [Aegilops geniculata]
MLHFPQGSAGPLHAKPQALRPHPHPPGHHRLPRPRGQRGPHPAAHRGDAPPPHRDADHRPLERRVRQAPGGDTAARELVLIAVGLFFVTLALVFAKQILAFSAASTTYSGDRYSLAELLRRVAKWGNLRGPLVTVGVVTALQLTFMALLGVYLSTVMRHAEALSVQGALFALAFLAFMYFGVVAVVGVAVSVADEGCRGVRALLRAWQLMTRVSRKEGALLAAVMVLLSTAVSPVYALALVYAKKSMAVGLCLLFGYALLSAAVELFYMAAATVYYYEAMESKEVVVLAFDDGYYAKIPSGEGEANVWPPPCTWTSEGEARIFFG